MTRPDLSAIVEAAAGELFAQENDRAWGMAVGQERDFYLSVARPIVTATLRALAPLAGDWDARAQRAYRDAQRAIERAETAETSNDAHKHAERAHEHERRGDTLATCARELRAVIAS